MISGGITITVLEVAGDKVRVGIEAPPDVEIHRQEVLDKIEVEGRRRPPRQ